VSLPYPNPVLHAVSFVTLDVKSPCPQTAQWTVFTTAYRKVAEGEKALSGDDQLQWNLRDSRGKSVSNGVYFMRIVGNGGPYTAKIVVLR
jgi:hypothetical protein